MLLGGRHVVTIPIISIDVTILALPYIVTFHRQLKKSIATMDTSSSYATSTPRSSLPRQAACVLSFLLISTNAATSSAFTSPIFQEKVTLQRKAPSKTSGVEIELPDFEEMFGRIRAVSPLAKLAINGGGTGEGGGFAAIDDTRELLLSTIFVMYLALQWKF